MLKGLISNVFAFFFHEEKRRNSSWTCRVLKFDCEQMVCNELGLSLSYISFWRWRKYYVFFFHLKIGQYIHYMTCMWCASLQFLQSIRSCIWLHCTCIWYIITLLLSRFQPYFLFRCFRFTKASPQIQKCGSILQTRPIQHTERIQENWKQKRIYKMGRCQL